jgi:imidazoleglycerol-phosphate dehydratase
MAVRTGKVTRNTKETSIKAELALDGSSKYQITTGIRFFDHMLCQLAQHGIFDITLSASGSDDHHVIEDVGIVLGRAFNQALGNRQGIVRFADATVPMDDALAQVALDIGGRGFAVLDAPFTYPSISDMPTDLISHFFISFAAESKINIHIKVLAGTNDHHKAEAIFKALARALDKATRFDPRIKDITPSTKDIIEQ